MIASIMEYYRVYTLLSVEHICVNSLIHVTSDCNEAALCQSDLLELWHKQLL